MTDLKERFSLADEIGMRDLWSEARRRAATPEAPPRAYDWPPALGRRFAAAAVALAVFATAGVFAWDLSHPDPSFGPTPSPAVDLASELPEGWSELPAPPEVRSGAATAWTGSQLLVWGGYEYTGDDDDSPFEDALVFDAASRTWTRVPGGPLEARAFAGSAWTGSEFLVWGGDDMGKTRNFFADGAAYDPEARSWSMLPEAPILGRAPLSVWTGKEFIVWGTAIRAGPYLDGAAYDPTARSWRVIADAPIELTDATAAWTGEEMIVFGASLDGNNHSETPTAIGAAYDPETDIWRELPPSDLSPQAHTAAWLNGELIAWDYEHGTAAYDPGPDVWRALPKVPLSFAECGPDSVATPQLVLGNYCGQTVLFSLQEDAWHREPIPGLEGEGCCRVLEPVAAGNVVMIPSHSYGMGLGEPDRRMFAFNPPAAVRTDPRGEVFQPEPFIPPTERDGDRILMPITFPDGSEATLSYPIPLDLATLGVQPDVSYHRTDEPETWLPVVFQNGSDASIAPFVDRSGPDLLVNHSSGGLDIWRFNDRWIRRLEQGSLEVPEAHWIRFRLPRWTVLVAIRRLEDWQEVLENLTVRETSSGFPVVDASGSIVLNEGHSDAGGPQLSFGDRFPDPGTITDGDLVDLYPDPCTPGTELGPPGYGSSCLGHGDVFANVRGEQAFVDDVIKGLHVETFERAVT